jgi:RecJ-like exonuclease
MKRCGSCFGKGRIPRLIGSEECSVCDGLGYSRPEYGISSLSAGYPFRKYPWNQVEIPKIVQKRLKKRGVKYD